MKRLEIFEAGACDPVLPVVGTGGAFARVAARDERVCHARVEEPAPLAFVAFVEADDVPSSHADVRRLKPWSRAPGGSRRRAPEAPAGVPPPDPRPGGASAAVPRRRRRRTMRDDRGRTATAGAVAAPRSMGSFGSFAGIIISEAADRIPTRDTASGGASYAAPLPKNVRLHNNNNKGKVS